MFITRKKLQLLQDIAHSEGMVFAESAHVKHIARVKDESYNRGRADGYTAGVADGMETAKKAFSRTIEKLATQKLQGITQENKHDILR